MVKITPNILAMQRMINFCILFLLFSSGFAQVNDTLKTGSLVIHSSSKLDSLVQMNTRINAELQTMPGYRVQVYFGPDRKKANEVKSGFLQKFQDQSAYLIYQQPNYKVRLGDFRTRIEAYKLTREISAEFPSAFIVKDEIALPVLD